jgi:hypothetical protein
MLTVFQSTLSHGASKVAMAALEMNLPLNMVSIGLENVLAALMHRSNQLKVLALLLPAR